MVEAHFNQDCLLDYVKTDDGNIWTTTNSAESDVADTIFRCYARYTIDDEETITLYTLGHVISNHPVPLTDSLASLADNPIKFVSSWKSGGYLNLHTSFLTTGTATHTFIICEDSVCAGTAYLSLRHLRPAEDAESYTQDLFVSIPLAHYIACDSVCLDLCTYNGKKEIKYGI